MKHIYIIAEIGCNHCGDIKLAKNMVDEAKACGVDAVKFQTFKATELISKYAPKAEYQKLTTGTEDNQLEMTRKLEISYESYIELRDYAIEQGLDVFSTPFDMDSLDFLAESGQAIWKIPSGEITNLPYLEKIAKIKVEGKKILLSTGMSTILEIERAVDIIGMYDDLSHLILLHCNTEYPTPDCDVNLGAIDALHEAFPTLQIGYSDHSIGYVAAIGAVMKDIVLVEKHFTLNKDYPGPDHKASANPEELAALVEGVRRVCNMVGVKEKLVTYSERKNIAIARKSIVARHTIKKGTIFTKENLTCKRPGNGISPMEWYNVLGQTATRDFGEDELIDFNE